MITITKKGNFITFKGHANYHDDLDILCASVSSIMYTTVNAIMRFNKDAINYQDNGEIVKIEVKNNDEITSTLIDNMMSLFMELASKYPKNIKIESEE